MSIEPWLYHDGGLALVGELHHPVGNGNGRAVLVVHEADGIGGNVRRRCAMLADLGYVAAAADMHGGGRVLSPTEMQPAMFAFRSDTGFLRRRVRAAADALLAVTGCRPGAVAAIGYCFGGMAVLELARSGMPIAAVASFHGLLPTNVPAMPGAVKARVLVSTGALDPLVPARDVAAFETEMGAAGADWHVIVHGRALHSFTNAAVDGLGDARMAYDRNADVIAWAAALAFLEESFGAAAAGGPRGIA